MSAAPPVYAQARAETAAMLGYDVTSLTAEQATRLDVAAALRLAVDDQSGKLARGETADVTKLLSASEALARLLPPLREPPPAADEPDPREVMWQIYSEMRRRGELADSYRSPQQRLEAAQAQVAEIEAELAASTAITPTESDIVPPGEIGECYVGGPPPRPDDPPRRAPVVIEGKAAPAAPSSAAPQNWDDTDNGRKWQAWHDAGGGAHYYRWSNRNW
jgi:hypothetical protein